MGDELRVACGVYGVLDHRGDPVLPNMYWGLKSLNHRGHQSHGFTTYDGELHTRKGLNLIPRLSLGGMEKWTNELPGSVGIGNVRYSTSGGVDEKSLLCDTQPVVVEYPSKRWIALSYNGNIVNALQLEEEVQIKESVKCNCDSAAFCWKLIMELDNHRDVPEAVKACMNDIEGAYSVAILLPENRLIAFRDPHGIRPLCAGGSIGKEVSAIASESIGLEINGFKFEFEVNPGELIEASSNGFKRYPLIRNGGKLCAFEFAYFARPDSFLGSKYVYEVRERFGQNLFKEYSDILKRCDVIASMPETADDAAFGLHESSGIHWERAIRRHRYVTERAFIMLSRERRTVLNKKVSILEQRLKGKRVAIVDDSIVRGDTMREIIKRLRGAGAREIHVFVTFPKIIAPCLYGVDMATYGELIGSSHTSEEIGRFLGADTINYQSIDGLAKSIDLSQGQLCLACITGRYPTSTAQKIADRMKNLFENGVKEQSRIYEEKSIFKRG